MNTVPDAPTHPITAFGWAPGAKPAMGYGIYTDIAEKGVLFGGGIPGAGVYARGFYVKGVGKTLLFRLYDTKEDGGEVVSWEFKNSETGITITVWNE